METMGRARGDERRDAGEEAAGRLLEVAAEGLRATFSDLELVDADLVADGRRLADLVALDGRGRLVLAIVLESGDPARADRALLAALDALAFARAHLPMIAAHLGLPRLRATLAPRVVLVAESFPPRLLDRLAGLDPDGVSCLEVRRISTRSGAGTYVVPVVGGAGSEGGSSDPRAFLEDLPADQRLVGELVVRRLARIDEELEPLVREGQLDWSLGGELVCSLVPGDGAIEARVPPEPRPRLIATADDVEPLVDAVLRRAIERLGPLAGPQSPPNPGFDPRAELLTPEEIEAFQQG